MEQSEKLDAIYDKLKEQSKNDNNLLINFEDIFAYINKETCECQICCVEIEEDQCYECKCGVKMHINCLHRSNQSSTEFKCPYCRNNIEEEGFPWEDIEEEDDLDGYSSAEDMDFLNNIPDNDFDLEYDLPEPPQTSLDDSNGLDGLDISEIFASRVTIFQNLRTFYTIMDNHADRINAEEEEEEEEE